MLVAAVALAVEATQQVVDGFSWDMLMRLTWPAAVVVGAYSPIGRALSTWIQSRSNLPPPPYGQTAAQAPQLAEAMHELATAIQTISSNQREHTEALQDMSKALAVLLDRTRGNAA